MTKHKYYEMICAKALDMSLVILHKSKHQNDGKWWAFDSDQDIIPSFDGEHYFACLPKHANKCLQWLNGVEIQFCTDENLRSYKPMGNTHIWTNQSNWMNPNCTFRAKPKIELIDGETYQFTAYDDGCGFEENGTYSASEERLVNWHKTYRLDEVQHIHHLVRADSFEKLDKFVGSLSKENISTITTPTGRFGGDEDTKYIDGYWVEAAKELLKDISDED